MVKIFVAILIAIIAHLVTAVRRARKVSGTPVPLRDVLIFFVLNALCAALLGTLAYEIMTALFG